MRRLASCQRPKMAAPDAVLSGLLTTTGLGAVYVNLHSKQPYYHAHYLLAECFLCKPWPSNMLWEVFWMPKTKSVTIEHMGDY